MSRCEAIGCGSEQASELAGGNGISFFVCDHHASRIGRYDVVCPWCDFHGASTDCALCDGMGQLELVCAYLYCGREADGHHLGCVYCADHLALSREMHPEA